MGASADRVMARGRELARLEAECATTTSAPALDSSSPLSRPDLSRCPEEWRSIGGSDIAAIMGLDPYRSHVDVYLRLGWGIESAETPAMRAGKRAEPYIAQMIGERVGLTVCPGDTWRGVTEAGTPVRSQADASAIEGGKPVGIECKMIGRHAKPWELDPLRCPEHYRQQAVWAMGHRGAAEWIVGGCWGFSDDESIVWRVPFDADLFARQIAAADAFWLDHFVPDDHGLLYPWEPPTAIDRARIAAACWPRVARKVIEPATPEEARWLADALAAKDTAGAVGKAKDEAYSAVKAAIRDREGIESGDVVATYSEAKDGSRRLNINRRGE